MKNESIDQAGKMSVFFYAFYFHINNESGGIYKATINITAKNVRKPVTKKSSCSVKKGKSIWVGPSYGGVHPSTKNWKSSNSRIATVATKGDSEGGHKVTAKKKGKVTISCIVSKTSRHWVKGDVFKWTVTVK